MIHAQPKPRPRIVTTRAERRARALLVQAVRAAVWKREHGRCRVCRIQPAAHLHHLQYRSRGGAHSVENTVAVCALHHALLHAHEIRPTGMDATDPNLGFVTKTR